MNPPLSHRPLSYAECSSRERLRLMVDAGSFHEFLPPSSRTVSPHLVQLGIPGAFDDGVAVGLASMDGKRIAVAAQEGEFMGGGVGEVHGAKLVGLLKRAMQEPAEDRVEAVVLLVESGGVRLHEANAGLIAVSEVMRAVLDVRAAGIPVIVVIGGANGCFGGMGIVARCADQVVMSDVGRLAMSGPEVIEASHGVEEFDSRDRALVWRTTGGKHRWLVGDCDVLVEDDVAALRAAVLQVLSKSRAVTLQSLREENALLHDREQLLAQVLSGDEATGLWRLLGVAEAEQVPEMRVDALRHAATFREDQR